MTMDEADEGSNDRGDLPDGLLEPGRMTTTADPIMRKQAEDVIQEHAAVKRMSRDEEEPPKQLPDGLIKPGRMTTTADPVMRKEAKEFLENHADETDLG